MPDAQLVSYGVTFCGREAQFAAAARLQQAADVLNTRWPCLPFEGAPPLGKGGAPPFKIILMFLGGVAIGHFCEKWHPHWATDRELDYSGVMLPSDFLPVEFSMFAVYPNGNLLPLPQLERGREFATFLQQQLCEKATVITNSELRFPHNRVTPSDKHFHCPRLQTPTSSPLIEHHVRIWPPYGGLLDSHLRRVNLNGRTVDVRIASPPVVFGTLVSAIDSDYASADHGNGDLMGQLHRLSLLVSLGLRENARVPLAVLKRVIPSGVTTRALEHGQTTFFAQNLITTAAEARAEFDDTNFEILRTEYEHAVRETLSILKELSDRLDLPVADEFIPTARDGPSSHSVHFHPPPPPPHDGHN
ncbi:hypothetical protein JCM10212_003488 [Sporobolomyces blumeae]